MRNLRPLTLCLALLFVGASAPAIAKGPRQTRSKAKPAAKIADKSKRVVLFLGMPGSGKSFASKRLAKRLGAARPLVSGDLIRAAVGKTRSPKDRARKVLEVAKKFNKNPGEIGRRMAEKVSQTNSKTVIVEGFRNPVDVKTFKREFPQAVVVTLEVPTELRHTRMLKRGRSGEDNRTYLKKRDRVEIKNGVRRAMNTADMRLKVQNNDLAALDRELGKVATVVRAPRKRAAPAKKKK